MGNIRETKLRKIFRKNDIFIKKKKNAIKLDKLIKKRIYKVR
jgi:hypothetical protein